MNGKLAGKVALVTGAGRGIGAAIALKLASEGADLVLNDLDPAPLNESAEAIRKLGRKAVTVPGDITKKEFPDAFVGAALKEFGRLDVIVNNAGYTWDNVIQKMQDEQWQAIVDVHLGAPFRILRAAATYIRDASKREKDAGEEVFRKVVNISSTSGIYGNPGQANYSSAKAGLIGLTKATARELASRGITVNAVAPGFVLTELTKDLPEALQAEITSRTPLGRFGTTEEVADAVAFLASDEAGYITGQVLAVDGGLVMM